MSAAGKQGGRLRFGFGGPSSGEEAKNTRSTIRRLIGYAQPYTKQLILVAALVMISTFSGLAGPILLGVAIDQAIIPGNIEILTRIVLILLAIFLIGGIAAIVHGVMMVSIAQKLIADLRGGLFNHLQWLSMSYHDQHHVGDLMSRVTNDTEAINQVLSNGLIQFITNILLLGGIMVSMAILNWQLAIGTLILLPLMLLITQIVTRRSRVAFREVQFNLGNLNAVTEENISGLRVVSAFARGPQVVEEFEMVNLANKKAGIKANIITAALGPMFTTMSTITIAITALIGGWLALRGIVSVGVIATFVVYIMNFFRPMRTIAMLYNHLQSALAGSERIFEVLDENPMVADAPKAQPLRGTKGVVEFSQVSFGYEAGKPVIRDVSLYAEAGQTVALVGPTGAGKTTIINLLSRFYDVDQGSIMIDGQDIRTLQQSSIRQQLGIVLQDTFLFSGTVFENIRYGRLQATDDEVIEAAKLSNADWFIRRLPKGYNTEVSERGHNFSQGQRQLLAIARAILANPRILILDEATSSVDTRTEMNIQAGLLRLMQGRTAFVIAHRLSTIREADLVLVIENGQIIESGTHDSLLTQKGFYYQLYMSQFRHDNLAQQKK